MDKLMGPVDGAYWNLRSHHVAKAAVLLRETAETILDEVGVSRNDNCTRKSTHSF